MRFDEFGLNDKLLDAIHYMNFETATQIQVQAIPEIMAGKDLIASAQTGTGKTAAFILPILDKLTNHKFDGIDTLILVPTRELALQIDQQIQGFSYFIEMNSIAVYGGSDGSDWEPQRRALMGSTDIVVATPGKLLSHLNLGYVRFDHLKHLILDEADRMLDMGFFEDIQRIISYIPKERQTMMFSATMPPRIRELARQILKNPAEINIELSKPAEGVLQAVYPVFENQKIPLIQLLINDKPEYKTILIFSSTKRKVTEIVRSLKNRDYSVEGISSDLEQKQREEVLRDFKARNTRVLVATDVLSRGIDIKDIDLIINFDAPGDAEDYVHRVGRTARAKATGVALTLINPDDMYKFRKIEQLIGNEVIKLPLPADLGNGPEWNERPVATIFRST